MEDKNSSENGTLSCELCCLEFQSNQAYKEHEWSLPHHQKLAKEHGKDYTHSCSLCNKELSGFLAYVKHIEGERHKKALRELADVNTKKPPSLLSKAWPSQAKNHSSWKTNKTNVSVPLPTYKTSKDLKSQMLYPKRTDMLHTNVTNFNYWNNFYSNGYNCWGNQGAYFHNNWNGSQPWFYGQTGTGWNTQHQYPSVWNTMQWYAGNGWQQRPPWPGYQRHPNASFYQGENVCRPPLQNTFNAESDQPQGSDHLSADAIKPPSNDTSNISVNSCNEPRHVNSTTDVSSSGSTGHPDDPNKSISHGTAQSVSCTAGTSTLALEIAPTQINVTSSSYLNSIIPGSTQVVKRLTASTSSNNGDSYDIHNTKVESSKSNEVEIRHTPLHCKSQSKCFRESDGHSNSGTNDVAEPKEKIFPSQPGMVIESTGNSVNTAPVAKVPVSLMKEYDRKPENKVPKQPVQTVDKVCNNSASADNQQIQHIKSRVKDQPQEVPSKVPKLIKQDSDEKKPSMNIKYDILSTCHKSKNETKFAGSNVKTDDARTESNCPSITSGELTKGSQQNSGSMGTNVAQQNGGNFLSKKSNLPIKVEHIVSRKVCNSVEVATKETYSCKTLVLEAKTMFRNSTDLIPTGAYCANLSGKTQTVPCALSEGNIARCKRDQNSGDTCKNVCYRQDIKKTNKPSKWDQYPKTQSVSNKPLKSDQCHQPQSVNKTLQGDSACSIKPSKLDQSNRVQSVSKSLQGDSSNSIKPWTSDKSNEIQSVCKFLQADTVNSIQPSKSDQSKRIQSVSKSLHGDSATNIKSSKSDQSHRTQLASKSSQVDAGRGVKHSKLDQSRGTQSVSKSIQDDNVKCSKPSEANECNYTKPFDKPIRDTLSNKQLTNSKTNILPYKTTDSGRQDISCMDHERNSCSNVVPSVGTSLGESGRSSPSQKLSIGKTKVSGHNSSSALIKGLHETSLKAVDIRGRESHQKSSDKTCSLNRNTPSRESHDRSSQGKSFNKKGLKDGLTSHDRSSHKTSSHRRISQSSGSLGSCLHSKNSNGQALQEAEFYEKSSHRSSLQRAESQTTGSRKTKLCSLGSQKAGYHEIISPRPGSQGPEARETGSSRPNSRTRDSQGSDKRDSHRSTYHPGSNRIGSHQTGPHRTGSRSDISRSLKDGSHELASHERGLNKLDCHGKELQRSASHESDVHTKNAKNPGFYVVPHIPSRNIDTLIRKMRLKASLKTGLRNSKLSSGYSSTVKNRVRSTSNQRPCPHPDTSEQIALSMVAENDNAETDLCEGESSSTASVNRQIRDKERLLVVKEMSTAADNNDSNKNTLTADQSLRKQLTGTSSALELPTDEHIITNQNRRDMLDKTRKRDCAVTVSRDAAIESSSTLVSNCLQGNEAACVRGVGSTSREMQSTLNIDDLSANGTGKNVQKIVAHKGNRNETSRRSSTELSSVRVAKLRKEKSHDSLVKGKDFNVLTPGKEGGEPSVYLMFSKKQYFARLAEQPLQAFVNAPERDMSEDSEVETDYSRSDFCGQGGVKKNTESLGVVKNEISSVLELEMQPLSKRYSKDHFRLENNEQRSRGEGKVDTSKMNLIDDSDINKSDEFRSSVGKDTNGNQSQQQSDMITEFLNQPENAFASTGKGQHLKMSESQHDIKKCISNSNRFDPRNSTVSLGLSQRGTQKSSHTAKEINKTSNIRQRKEQLCKELRRQKSWKKSKKDQSIKENVNVSGLVDRSKISDGASKRKMDDLGGKKIKNMGQKKKKKPKLSSADNQVNADVSKKDQSHESKKKKTEKVKKSKFEPDSFVGRDIKQHFLAVTAVKTFGHFLFSTSLDGTIRIYNRKTGQTVKCLNETNAVNCMEIAFLDKEPFLFYGGDSKKVIKTRLKNLKVHSIFNFDHRITAIHFGFSKLYVGLADGSMSILSANKGEVLVDKVKCHFGERPLLTYIISSRYKSTTSLVITAGCDNKITIRDAEFFRWTFDRSNEFETGDHIRTIDHHRDYVLCLQVRKNCLISCSMDCSLVSHSIGNGTLVKTYKTHPRGITVCLSIGKIIVTSCLDGLIRCIEHESGKLVQSYFVGPRQPFCVHVADNLVVYVGTSDGHIITFQLNVCKYWFCKWKGCNLPVGEKAQLQMHLEDHIVRHVDRNDEIVPAKCQWVGCQNSLPTEYIEKEIATHARFHVKSEKGVHEQVFLPTTS